MARRIMTSVLLFALLSAAVLSCSKAELTDDEIYELYGKAREAYGWFHLTTIPFDSEKYIESDGMTYYEVNYPGIASKDELAEYLNALFDSEITDSLLALSSERYVEQDGRLYVLPADRGTDIFKGEETYEVARISDKQIKFTVKVEVYDDPETQNVTGYETHDFIIEYEDGFWKFQNFESVR